MAENSDYNDGSVGMPCLLKVLFIVMNIYVNIYMNMKGPLDLMFLWQ